MDGQNQISSLWDYITDTNNYDTAVTKQNVMYLCVPPVGTQFVNKLTGSVVQTTRELPYVVTLDSGEYEVCGAATLYSRYITAEGRMLTGQHLTSMVIHAQKVKESKGSIPWNRIKAKSGVVDVACFVPVQYKGSIHVATAMGTVQINADGIPHGKGDFIVCRKRGDDIDFNTMRVVNGLLFAKLYDNRGWQNCLGKSKRNKVVAVSVKHTAPIIAPNPLTLNKKQEKSSNVPNTSRLAPDALKNLKPNPLTLNSQQGKPSTETNTSRLAPDALKNLKPNPLTTGQTEKRELTEVENFRGVWDDFLRCVAPLFNESTQKVREILSSIVPYKWLSMEVLEPTEAEQRRNMASMCEDFVKYMRSLESVFTAPMDREVVRTFSNTVGSMLGTAVKEIKSAAHLDVPEVILTALQSWTTRFTDESSFILEECLLNKRNVFEFRFKLIVPLEAGYEFANLFRLYIAPGNIPAQKRILCFESVGSCVRESNSNAKIPTENAVILLDISELATAYKQFAVVPNGIAAATIESAKKYIFLHISNCFQNDSGYNSLISTISAYRTYCQYLKMLYNLSEASIPYWGTMQLLKKYTVIDSNIEIPHILEMRQNVASLLSFMANCHVRAEVNTTKEVLRRYRNYCEDTFGKVARRIEGKVPVEVSKTMKNLSGVLFGTSDKAAEYAEMQILSPQAGATVINDDGHVLVPLVLSVNIRSANVILTIVGGFDCSRLGVIIKTISLSAVTADKDKNNELTQKLPKGAMLVPSITEYLANMHVDKLAHQTPVADSVIDMLLHLFAQYSECRLVEQAYKDFVETAWHFNMMPTIEMLGCNDATFKALTTDFISEAAIAPRKSLIDLLLMFTDQTESIQEAQERMGQVPINTMYAFISDTVTEIWGIVAEKLKGLGCQTAFTEAIASWGTHGVPEDGQVSVRKWKSQSDFTLKEGSVHGVFACDYNGLGTVEMKYEVFFVPSAWGLVMTDWNFTSNDGTVKIERHKEPPLSISFMHLANLNQIYGYSDDILAALSPMADEIVQEFVQLFNEINTKVKATETE